MPPSKGFGTPPNKKKPDGASNRLSPKPKANDTAIAKTLPLAIQYHQAGNWAAAEPLYRQVLKQHPDHAGVHHQLGFLAYQTGRIDEAIAYLKTAIALTPEEATFHNHLGIMLAEQDRRAEAIPHFQTATTLNPNHANIRSNFGNALRLEGEIEAAVEQLQMAVTLDPTFATAHSNLALALMEQGNLDAARSHAQEAIALKPNYVEAYYNLALILEKQNNPEEAIATHEQAIALNPAYAPSYTRLGAMLRDSGQLERAMEQLAKALSLAPGDASTHLEVGLTYKRQEQESLAESHFRRVLELDPTNPYAHLNLGGLFWGRQHLQEAIVHYQQAIDLKPNLPEAHVSLAYAYLIQGDFKRGLEEYDWRWEIMPPPLLLQPVWDGSSLDGQTLLIHMEGGFGDVIQFIRYIPLLKERGAQVIVTCRPELKRLLSTLDGLDHLITPADPLPEFQVHLPLLHLPYVLETTLDTIPAQIPYLSAPVGPPHPLDQFPNTTRRVGVAWASGVKTAGNFNKLLDQGLVESYQARSCPLSLFSQLFSVPGISFYSLQVGENAAELKHLNADYPIHDLSSHIQDFADTAAFIEQLDLVISVDTAVVHLAGALGKPTWVLLPFAADWRWLLERDDSPWYPSMRLFRQSAPGDWDSLLKEVTTAMQGWIASQEARKTNSDRQGA